MSFAKPQMEGLISDAHPDFDRIASPAMKAAVERARKAAERSTDELAKEADAPEDIRARYKIEVRFVNQRDSDGRILRQRTVHGPNLCGVMLWESGKAFHGGGDSKAYWCMDSRPGEKGGCGGVISGEYITGGVATCPNCRRTVNSLYLTDMLVFRLSTQKLAERVADMFRKLGNNADVYCKYDKGDPHYLAMARERGWEVANRLKGMAIYPLANILKETANGADLAKRIQAFLSA